MTGRLGHYTRAALAHACAPHTGYPRNPAATALRLWFAANPEASPKEMAMLCGVHQTTILYLRNGRRRPGVILARKIERLTKGAVPRTLWNGVRIRPLVSDPDALHAGAASATESVYGELLPEDSEDVGNSPYDDGELEEPAIAV